MNIETLKTNYYKTTFGKEDSALRKIRTQAQNQGVEYMQLSPADARLLQFLTRTSQAQNAIEIGGLYGYSTLHIARGLKKNGQVFSLDIDLERQEISKQLIQKESEFSKITWIHGDAHKTLLSLSEKAPFDMVFIDADKAGYLEYLLWAEQNLKVGGIVVADNSFLFHTLYAEEPELSKLRKIHNVSPSSEKILKEFNQRIVSSPYWMGAMIPTEDGLTVGYKLKHPN